LGGKRLILTNPIMTAKHRSREPLVAVGVRELLKYYLSEEGSTATSQIMRAERRSLMPQRKRT